MFQFSAKSDNIYYAYLQSGQNHTLIPPPLEVAETIFKIMCECSSSYRILENKCVTLHMFNIKSLKPFFIYCTSITL